MSANPLRDPPEETVDLYPGLVVCDERMSGSITFGRTRLPAYAVMGELCRNGWESVAADWPELIEQGWTAQRLATFACAVLEPRGELGRLLLLLADIERREWERSDKPNEDSWTRSWWTDDDRKALATALRAALACVEGEAMRPGVWRQVVEHFVQEEPRLLDWQLRVDLLECNHFVSGGASRTKHRRCDQCRNIQDAQDREVETA